jgi:hypothetical protein
MTRSFNFASFFCKRTNTFPRREQTLIMLDSIKDQFDVVRCYFNNVDKRPDFLPDFVQVVVNPDLDLTDLGKFYFLDPLIEEYYFTGDDDIQYPSTYADDMVQAIEQHKCVVSHHGRVLKEKGVNYYLSHKTHRCLNLEEHTKILDVCGSGVTAFKTTDFCPYWITYSQDRKMSDLTFSLECAKHEIKIVGLPHSHGYIKDLPTPQDSNICESSFHNQDHLIAVADKIIDIKNNEEEN